MSDHPYGFPDEWHWREEIVPGSYVGGVRSFAPPDPLKLPAERLRDFGLFRRLLLSLRDFAQARSSIVFIREELDYEKSYSRADWRRFQCYETTLIVSYCRPFSQSTAGLPRLSYKILGVSLAPFVDRLHRELIDKRNRIFAHSDIDHIEYVNPVILHSKDKHGKSFTVLYPPRFREETLLSRAELEQVDVLLGDVINAVMAMLQAMHPNFKDRYPSVQLDA